MRGITCVRCLLDSEVTFEELELAAVIWQGDGLCLEHFRRRIALLPELLNTDLDQIGNAP